MSACLSVSLLHIVSSTTATGKYLLLASALINEMYNVNMRMDVEALYFFIFFKFEKQQQKRRTHNPCRHTSP